MDLIDALDRYTQYLYAEKGLLTSTISSYQDDIRLFFSCFPDKRTTDDLLPSDIGDFAIKEGEKDRSSASIGRRVSSLYNFYSFLSKQGLVEEISGKIDRPKGRKHLPTVLSEEEVEALLDAPNVEKESGSRDKAMLETMYSTGLRVSELCSLKLSEVNLEQGLITVSHGKGDKTRIVPIGDYALSYLLDYIKGFRNSNVGRKSPYIFLNHSGKPISRIYFFQSIRKYALEAHIDKTISPHTLRHCFATHLLDAGAELKAVSEMLGHANLETTAIYLHVGAKRIISAYEKYASRK